MESVAPETVFRYLQWGATEEDNDAEFLEECADRFDATRESFLRSAKAYRTRAKNIRVYASALQKL